MGWALLIPPASWLRDVVIKGRKARERLRMHEALRHRVETCISALLPLLVKQVTGLSPESRGGGK